MKSIISDNFTIVQIPVIDVAMVCVVLELVDGCIFDLCDRNNLNLKLDKEDVELARKSISNPKNGVFTIREFLPLLLPIRDKVAIEIAKLIEKKEIEVDRVFRHMNGKININRTEINEDAVDKVFDIFDRANHFSDFQKAYIGDKSQRAVEHIIYEVTKWNDYFRKLIYGETAEVLAPDDLGQKFSTQEGIDAYFDYVDRYPNNPIRHVKIQPPQKAHLNSERFASNREQVLGAALSVLARYPEQCINKVGNLEATKIRVLIEEKALLFWPETGEPVLGSEAIERLIRDWLKKTGE
jgi:hypothetical protein